MLDDNERTAVVHEGSPRWVVPAMIVLGVLALVGMWIGWRGLTYAQDSRASLNSDIRTTHQELRIVS